MTDASAPRRPSLPDGVRIYAIGDVHGRADLLGRMAELIAADCRDRPVREARTILLGDYVDRGPDAAAVLDRLARRDMPTPLLALTGNHEQILRDVLAGTLDLSTFVRNGGDATLRAYGLDLEALLRMPAQNVGDAIRAALPDAHRAVLDGLRLSASEGDYFFCHAGVRPGVPLDAQDPDDLVWIRAEFLRSRADFGKVVVHGHTPAPQPESRPNRIGVDTGAFASGVLTAAVLEGTGRRFLQARDL